MELSEGRSGPQTVANRLERAIQKGEIRPGEAVPSERELAAQWGYSRPIIREGISMLVAKGILTRRHGRGTFLNDISQQVGSSIWADLSRRHPDLQAHLLEFRHMLERRSAELAAERHDARDRQRLQDAEAAVHLAFSARDRQQRMRADLALHHSIADATHNPVYGYLMRSMHKMLHEHMELSLIGHDDDAELLGQVQRQHRLLVQAILARDAEAAGQIAAGHIEFIRVRLNHLGPGTAARQRQKTDRS
ncbi:MAG TPA: FadR/GntR family transcriptional regulator [Solimonas sp.]